MKKIIIQRSILIATTKSYVYPRKDMMITIVKKVDKLLQC